MTIYQAAWYFIIFSFLGWCVEVVFHAVTQGKVINRGFLCGPVCPIYGTGVLSVLFFVEYLLPSFKGWLAANGKMPDARIPEIIVLFLFGMFAASLAELVTGWTLDKIFHERWWDYSDRPFNFHGYICPLFSILWGLAIVFVIRVLMPVILSPDAPRIPEKYGQPVLACVYCILLVDFGVTVSILMGLNKKLHELDELRSDMSILSDRLSEQLAGGTIELEEAAEKAKVENERRFIQLKEENEKRIESAEEEVAQAVRELRGKHAELSARYEEMKEKMKAHPFFGEARILNAFPSLKQRFHLPYDK